MPDMIGAAHRLWSWMGLSPRPAAWSIALAAALLTLFSGLADNLPAPRGSFRELRFSPDGRFVLAQDDSEITVLTLNPFAIAFRIPATHAGVAKFTPDSRQLAFVIPSRVVHPRRGLVTRAPALIERWTLADQTRSETIELHTRGCATEELSPDGAFWSVTTTRVRFEYLRSRTGAHSLSRSVSSS